MHRQDLLVGLIVVVVWGLNFIAIKLGVQEVPPLLLGALRFVFACFPAVFFLPKPPVSWGWLMALSLSINVGQFAFLFLGIKVGMPAGLASLVLQSQAFFTLFVAVTWFGERWQWHHLAGLTLAGCGMFIIGSQQGGSMSAAGFGMTIAAAACWGMGNVFMRRATSGVPPTATLALVVWAGIAAIMPLSLLSLYMEGWEAWVAAYHALSWSGAGSVAYLAYAATLIGYGIWGRLMSRYPAAVVSPLALLVPVVGLSSSALFLGETLSLWQVVGALLVMTGLVLHVMGGKLADWGRQNAGEQG